MSDRTAEIILKLTIGQCSSWVQEQILPEVSVVWGKDSAMEVKRSCSIIQPGSPVLITIIVAIFVIDAEEYHHKDNEWNNDDDGTQWQAQFSRH